VTITTANPAHRFERDVLDRDFTAKRPNQRWVTDITYVWTDEGWCYLAVILDSTRAASSDGRCRPASRPCGLGLEIAAARLCFGGAVESRTHVLGLGGPLRGLPRGHC
jgi:hypothetical protein